MSETMEWINCYGCGAEKAAPFINAQEDLTGKPGDFSFVRCSDCRLVYQQPRVAPEKIIDYYDDDYIAHRKTKPWGLLTPFFNWSMGKLDRDKDRLVSRYVELGADDLAVDIGCGTGSFLAQLRKRTGCRIAGVDFKDLSDSADLAEAKFYHGVYREELLGAESCKLITMWHFLEHDYDPMGSLRIARGHLAENGRMVIEVPRLDSRTFSWFKDRWPGLQAPQHTVLFDRASLEKSLAQTGWEIEEYLPYGAFPAYFYIFAGVAFKWRKGKGVNLQKAILPYLLGQILLSPLLLFERRLNLAMQTVVCRKKKEPVSDAD